MSDQVRQLKQAEITYTKWFLLLFLPLCIAILVFKRTDYFPWVGACDPQGYDQEHYLAYCHTTRFGDYEHYAFWHDTEQGQIQNLKEAEVLFLGNSRTQFAFSTQAVSDFFAKSGTPFFVFGFGLGGKSDIPQLLINKYKLKPRAVVINADPFFSDEQDDTLTRVIRNSKSTAWEHRAKIYLQKKQQQICDPRRPIPLLSLLICQGGVETLYRSRENGFWLTDYYLPEKSIPVTFNDSLLPSLDQRLELLNRFVSETGLRGDCILLTVTPHSGTPLEFARALSARAGLKAHFPNLSDLGTIDHSHLNKSSAERWSAAFLELARDDLEKCAATAG